MRTQLFHLDLHSRSPPSPRRHKNPLPKYHHLIRQVTMARKELKIWCLSTMESSMLSRPSTERRGWEPSSKGTTSLCWLRPLSPACSSGCTCGLIQVWTQESAVHASRLWRNDLSSHRQQLSKHLWNRCYPTPLGHQNQDAPQYQAQPLRLIEPTLQLPADNGSRWTQRIRLRV